MVNILLYNRATQLLALHPDWVDGAPGLPGPTPALLARAQGFLLRDIANYINHPKLSEQIRQVGRGMVVKSSTKGEKSLVVRTFDGENDPMNPNGWIEKIEAISGGKIPIRPEREPGPYGRVFPDYLNKLLMAEALQRIALLTADKANVSTIQSLGAQLGKEGFEQGQRMLLI